jgi:predicted ester cyclase
MSTEENRTIVRRVFDELFNKRNMDVIDELIDPNYRHYLNGTLNMESQEDLRNTVGRWIKGIPDFRLSFEDELAAGDKVVSRVKVNGTHSGELQFAMMPSPIPATGKPVEIEWTYITRLANGKVTETWGTFDVSWIQQLSQS